MHIIHSCILNLLHAAVGKNDGVHIPLCSFCFHQIKGGQSHTQMTFSSSAVYGTFVYKTVHEYCSASTTIMRHASSKSILNLSLNFTTAFFFFFIASFFFSSDLHLLIFPLFIITSIFFFFSSSSSSSSSSPSASPTSFSFSSPSSSPTSFSLSSSSSSSTSYQHLLLHVFKISNLQTSEITLIMNAITQQYIKTNHTL